MLAGHEGVRVQRLDRDRLQVRVAGVGEAAQRLAPAVEDERGPTVAAGLGGQQARPDLVAVGLDDLTFPLEPRVAVGQQQRMQVSRREGAQLRLTAGPAEHLLGGRDERGEPAGVARVGILEVGHEVGREQPLGLELLGDAAHTGR